MEYLRVGAEHLDRAPDALLTPSAISAKSAVWRHVARELQMVEHAPEKPEQETVSVGNAMR